VLAPPPALLVMVATMDKTPEQIAAGHECEPTVYPMPEAAINIVCRACDVGSATALDALRALISAGYVVAPREPTDGMLAAYIEALGQPTRNHETCIRNIGKARKRWQAMACAGTCVALSRKMIQAQENTNAD
jgi:hypothetical protein